MSTCLHTLVDETIEVVSGDNVKVIGKQHCRQRWAEMFDRTSIRFWQWFDRYSPRM